MARLLAILPTLSLLTFALACTFKQAPSPETALRGALEAESMKIEGFQKLERLEIEDAVNVSSDAADQTQVRLPYLLEYSSLTKPDGPAFITVRATALLALAEDKKTWTLKELEPSTTVLRFMDTDPYLGEP
jgi:hypothetical protein